MTGRGVAVLNASHGGRLRQLRLDGCRVCMSAVAGTVWRQPGSMCLWDPQKRGHLPRWVNIASALLWMGDASGSRRRLRLWHASEPSWLRLAGMLLGLAVAALVWLLLVLILSYVPFSIIMGVFVPLLRPPPWGLARWTLFWLELSSNLWDLGDYALARYKGRPFHGITWRLGSLAYHHILMLANGAVNVLGNFVPPPPPLLPPWLV